MKYTKERFNNNLSVDNFNGFLALRYFWFKVPQYPNLQYLVELGTMWGVLANANSFTDVSNFEF